MLSSASLYFHKIKQQFFKAVEKARTPCKRSLEEISDDDDCVHELYKPQLKKKRTSDEPLPSTSRTYGFKPYSRWSPRILPSFTTIKEDETDQPPTLGREYLKVKKRMDLREPATRQPFLTSMSSGMFQRHDTAPSISRKIIPPRMSGQKIVKSGKNSSMRAPAESWPRKRLGASNYSSINKKPLADTSTKWKPTAITETFRMEEKKRYQRLLHECTLNQSHSPRSTTCYISSSSANSSDVQWTKDSSFESPLSDVEIENNSPISFASNKLLRSTKLQSKQSKQEAESFEGLISQLKPSRTKIPLSDITTKKESKSGTMKTNESIVRSVSLCADDEEEFSLGHMLRQHPVEKKQDSPILMIDLSQSDCDSSDTIKSSESDSIEIVDEFAPGKTKINLKDFYDGKWMESKYDEYSSIAQKTKTKNEMDEQLKSERINQVEILHDKVQSRLKKLDLICSIPDKPQSLPRHIKKPSFAPLTPQMQDEIDAALIPYPKSEALIEKFNIKITRRDISTLNGLNWLNDEIINFYMNLIMERSMNNKMLPRVYAFSTFFYPKLYKSGHKSVSRWTKKVDIFSYDILLVPVHLGVHWCLATVDFKKQCISYYDSMLGDNPECLEVLLEYLKTERREKKGIFYKMLWKLECMKNIPEQMNGSDCGMFSCKFAEYKSRRAPLNFTQEDMPYFRQRMVYEILKGMLL